MLVLMAGVELPVKAIREQIAGGFDLLVHISRLVDGSRKIVQVTEIAGMEGDLISTHELFNFLYRGDARDGAIRGGFQSTGVRPDIVTRGALSAQDLHALMRRDRRVAERIKDVVKKRTGRKVEPAKAGEADEA